jgi:hypothetical protein
VNFVDGANILAAVGGFAACGGLIWLAARGDPEREAEEAARVFYDEHGHWPDEEPPAAA